MMISRANITPPMGALNTAAMPAAEPQPTSVRMCVRFTVKNCPSAEPKAEPTCTMGPSLPSEPPRPMFSDEATSFTQPTLPLMRPERSATASMTSGTP